VSRLSDAWGALRRDLAAIDGRAAGALVTAAVVLVLVQFRGKVAHWRTAEFVRSRAENGLEIDFVAQCCWAIATCVGFGLVPFLIATLLFRMKPSEFGFRWRGFLRHLWLYLALFALMLPLIYWAGDRPDFRRTYPFPILARRDAEHFWIWQAFYFSQFAAVEMFFRGFLVFALERRFGLNAIFVMTVPYTMIHFSKPMPEAFGAIFAGIALGYVALKTRSFYGGIVLHYLVAITMDLLATDRL
jgi:CAAX protease family protein